MTDILNSEVFLKILKIVITVVAAVVSITVHESAHGYAAYKCGDDTAKLYGRLSLNPLKHIDWIGALCLMIFKFGWAKPVPVNAFNFKNRKRDIVIVSLAGPVSNFILAFVAMFLGSVFMPEGFGWVIFNAFLWTLAYLNIGLGVFNLIPIPPLDGSKILGEFLSGGTKYKYLSFKRYGSLVLILVFAIRPLNNIFSSVLSFLQGLLISGYISVIEFILGVF